MYVCSRCNKKNTDCDTLVLTQSATSPHTYSVLSEDEDVEEVDAEIVNDHTTPVPELTNSLDEPATHPDALGSLERATLCIESTNIANMIQDTPAAGGLGTTASTVEPETAQASAVHASEYLSETSVVRNLIGSPMRGEKREPGFGAPFESPPKRL